MKKLIFLVFAGLVILTSPSYATRYLESTNKTVLQQALVGSTGLGTAQVAFVTGTTNSNTVGVCSSAGAVATPAAAASGFLLSCPGMPITGVMLSGGASGGTVTIYDANTNQLNQAFPAEVGVAEVVYEATVAANTQNYVDLSNAPINTNNGIVAIASSTSGVIVYSSPAGTTNK